MLKKSEVLREGYIKGLKAGKEVVSKMLKESYNGQLKVICDLDHYKPWSGAVDTWNQIQDAGAVEAFEAAMADMYPDGIEMGKLNDFLWFESESALSMAGIQDTTEMEVELDADELDAAEEQGDAAVEALIKKEIEAESGRPVVDFDTYDQTGWSIFKVSGIVWGNEEDNEEITGSVKHDDSDEVLVSSDEEEEGLPTDTNIAVDPTELANCKNDDDVNDLVMDSVINKYGRAMRGCEKIRFIKENKFAVRGIHWVR